MTATKPLNRAVFWIRKGWRRLISMRTALVLLFLLAIASISAAPMRCQSR